MKDKENNSINSKSDKQIINILVVLNKLITLYYKGYTKKYHYYNNQINIIQDDINNPKILRWIGINSGGASIAKEEIDIGVENEETGEEYSVKGDYTVYVKDIKKLEKLYQDLRQKLGKTYKDRVNILLKNNKTIEWRCKKCGRFLGKFSEKNQLTDSLNDFVINQVEYNQAFKFIADLSSKVEKICDSNNFTFEPSINLLAKTKTGTLLPVYLELFGDRDSNPD